MAKELTPAEIKRATERVEDAFIATGRTLERLTKQRGVAPMLRLIEQAHADLERKLRNLGKPGETFTEVQRQALLAQYRAMMVQLQPRMVRTLGEASREAQVAGIRDLVKLVAIGEAEFEGVVTPLPLEQAARMAGIIDADRASLLRQHEVSIRTYGMQSIGEAEQFLAQSFMQAKGYAETTSGLLSMVEGSRYRAERIVRTECLVGDTRVSGAMVRAVHRRAYSGPVVEIVTAGGRKFTTTPNHPMLTRRGWVGSGSLSEGDDLVCDGRQEDFGTTSDEDVAARPTTIGEIFDSIATVGFGERVRTAQPDFHGDGMDGNVDIRRPLRMLHVGRFSALRKPLTENVFTPSDSTASLFCGACGGLLPVNQLCGVCDAANSVTGCADAKLDATDVQSKSVGQLLGGFASHVPSHDLGIGQVATVSRVRASGTVEVEPSLASIANDAGLLNHPADPFCCTSKPLTDLNDRQAIQIETDRVVSLRVRQFSGHVFNLTTEDGYFSVDGAYTGNCSFAYNTAHATAIDDASELVDGLMRRWTEYVDDATGRPLDARVANDSLVLHGQVCFQPEGATMEARSTFLVGGTGGFTMPPDGRVNAKLWGKRYAHPPNRPNDRSRLVPWKPTWGVPAYMVVHGVRMDVRKALAMMKGAEADEVLDVAEGEAIPEQKLASEDAVDASRAAFRREQERRNAEARARHERSRRSRS